MLKKQDFTEIKKYLDEELNQENKTFDYYFDDDKTKKITVTYKPYISANDLYSVVETASSAVFDGTTYIPSLVADAEVYSILLHLTDIDVEKIGNYIQGKHLKLIAYQLIEIYEENDVIFQCDLSDMILRKINYLVKEKLNVNNIRMEKVLSEIEQSQTLMETFIKKFQNIDLKKLAEATNELSKKSEKEIVDAIKVYNQNDKANKLGKIRIEHSKATKK